MRQHKLLHNVIRWRKYAGDKYGLGLLATSLVSDCIFPVAEGGWEVGGEDVMRKVSAVGLQSCSLLTFRARLLLYYLRNLYLYL